MEGSMKMDNGMLVMYLRDISVDDLCLMASLLGVIEE